jgi:hypothetical protein
LTRFLYDQFSKDYLESLFLPYGTPQAAKNIAPEVLEIDFFFTPRSCQPIPELGLLGKFGQNPALFEVYRNPVTRRQILDCICKQIFEREDLEREAKTEKRQFPESEEPHLWILTPTASQRLIKRFDGKTEEEYGLGVYNFSEAYKAALVVIHQLPETPETLWVRILGRGSKQTRAINELEALPEDHPYKARTLELLYNLSRNLEVNQKPTLEDRRLIMRLAPLFEQEREMAFQQGLEQGLEQGIQQGTLGGRQAEAVNLIIRQLNRRWGEIPPDLAELIPNLPLETLENLAEALLDFQAEEDLRAFLENHI